MHFLGATEGARSTLARANGTRRGGGSHRYLCEGLAHTAGLACPLLWQALAGGQLRAPEGGSRQAHAQLSVLVHVQCSACVITCDKAAVHAGIRPLSYSRANTSPHVRELVQTQRHAGEVEHGVSPSPSLPDFLVSPTEKNRAPSP